MPIFPRGWAVSKSGNWRRYNLLRSIVALAVLFSCATLISSAWAADASYSTMAPDEYLKEWLVLGPIPAQEKDSRPSVEGARTMGLERDLLEQAGGEAKVMPAAGESVAARGGDYQWQKHESKADVVDLIELLGQHDYSVAYAAATIESPEDKTLAIGLGSDDGVRIWLNGELIHDHSAPRAVVVDDDVLSVKLRKGTNRLLIKVINDQGDWGYALRALSPSTLATRLFQAASQGRLETVEELIALGVDVNLPSPAGITAAQIAKVRGYDDIVAYLVSKGAAAPQPFEPGPVLRAIFRESAKGATPGIAVLVARDGEILFDEGFGFANLERDEPITTATKFRIGSITKQFAAAAILKLQQEGKLSVNDKLSKFLPDFPRGDDVTIHHLLTHTSGIKSFTSKPDFMSTVTTPATNEQMIDSFKNEPFDFEPGSKMMYNNSGYFLLGVIIEKVSGKPFGEYLRETFFEPLGMHDTGVHSSKARPANEATGYSYGGGKATVATDWDMSRAGAAGALYSTVGDLMRWNEGIFNGEVLSKDSLAAAFTPVELDDGEQPMMQYGYGWIMGSDRGLKTISHGGGLNGWSAYLSRYVDPNVTIVVLHNAMPSVPGLAPDGAAELAAEAYLWQSMKPRPKYEVDTTVDPATFAAYVGRFDFMGAVMDIALEGEQLTAQLTGQPRFPIFPLGDDRFFWKVVDAQIQFIRNEQGNVVSAKHSQNGMNFSLKRLAEIKEVEVDEGTLDRYVGKYEYPGIGVATVRREGNRLFVQLVGQPEFEIYAKSPDTFFWKVVSAEVQFIVDENGKVTKAIHHQGGAKLEAKKIE